MKNLLFTLSLSIIPILKILASSMNMGEYVAGITIGCLGSSLPDLLVSLMPVREHAPIFTIAQSNSLAVVLIVGGVLCYLKPICINGYCTIRDILFLVLCTETVLLFLYYDRNLSKMDAICKFKKEDVYILSFKPILFSCKYLC